MVVTNKFANYLIREKTTYIIYIISYILTIFATAFLVWGVYKNLEPEELNTLRVVLTSLLFVIWILLLTANIIKLMNVLNIKSTLKSQSKVVPRHHFKHNHAK